MTPRRRRICCVLSAVERFVLVLVVVLVLERVAQSPTVMNPEIASQGNSPTLGQSRVLEDEDDDEDEND